MKNKAAIIAAVLVAFAVLGCGQLSEKLTGKKPSSSSPSSGPMPSSGEFSLDDKDWKRHDLAKTDIAIELFSEPKDELSDPSKIPAGTRSVFSAMSLHSLDDGEFRSSYTQLTPAGKLNVPIKQLADTSMASLKRQIPGLTYTLDLKSDTNAKYNGSFSRNGKEFEVKGCCIQQKGANPRVWAVVTIFPKDNADGRTASERIINSAQFKDSSETCN
jgi:hypothetical protein